MLVVTVELWPAGRKDQAKEIASIEIANISDLADVSDYVAHVQVEGWGDAPPLDRTVVIEGHTRRSGVLKLLKSVFQKLGDTR